LDADDVEGETDQDWREGRAPLSAGDIPNGGSGDPTGIVPGDSGADWAATVAHAVGWLMPTEQNSGTECNDGRIVPRIAQNSLDHPFTGQNDAAGARNRVLGWKI